MRGRVREEGPIDNRGYEATATLVCHGEAHGGAAGVIKKNLRR